MTRRITEVFLNGGIPILHHHARYPVFWGVPGVLILFVEHATVPEIQFPIVYALPLSLASRYGNVRRGIGLAVALPALRMGANLLWGYAFTLLLTVNAIVRMVVLMSLAVAVDRIMMLSREARALRGNLPGCSFSKNIRKESGERQQIERYIIGQLRSGVHPRVLSECAEEHYGEYLEKNT